MRPPNDTVWPGATRRKKDLYTVIAPLDRPTLLEVHYGIASMVPADGQWRVYEGRQLVWVGKA